MPLPRRHDLPYNRAKADAERMLIALRRRHGVELVLLRPGIVYGPRSQWIAGFADQLLDGTAYLVDGAQGICNAIYVDNLVHAVTLAITGTRCDGEALDRKSTRLNSSH